MTKDQVFHLKRHTWFQVQNFLFLFTLKNSEIDVKDVLLFHSFLQIFYKNFKILVLSYSLSHFAPISQKIDK